MNDHHQVDVEDVLSRLDPEAELQRVPSWVGAGEVLFASGPEGCVVIAPPATALRAGSTPESIRAWSLGWFPADDDGADLAAGPSEEAEAEFRSIWELPQIAPNRDYIKRLHEANINHFELVRVHLDGDDARFADGRLRDLRREWSHLFEDEPWPLDARDAGTGAPQPGRRSPFDVLASEGRRVIATLFPQQAAYLHGESATAELAETTEEVRFGPSIAIAGTGTDARLVVDFDELRAAHPEVTAAGLSVHVLGEGGEELARVSFRASTGRREAAIALDRALPPTSLRLVIALREVPGQS